MKKLIFALSFVCLSLFSLSAFAVSKPRDVFVQTSPQATITKLDTPHTYQLSLQNIQAYTTYFSDRPSRTSNMMTLESFLAVWNKGFAKDAPNASISGIINEKMVNFPAELTQPVYDAATKTLTYIIHPLAGTEDKIPSSLHISNVSVFIDPLCLTCFG
ncbi:MAG TPA: hypothetical protein VGV92_02825 [Gammaproteobacteria bacterium]|nr:hypothetical protein [Gammaproteobacteria bacterium]